MEKEKKKTLRHLGGGLFLYRCLSNMSPDSHHHLTLCPQQTNGTCQHMETSGSHQQPPGHPWKALATMLAYPGAISWAHHMWPPARQGMLLHQFHTPPPGQEVHVHLTVTGDKDVLCWSNITSTDYIKCHNARCGQQIWHAQTSH